MSRARTVPPEKLRHQGFWPGRMPYIRTGSGEPLLYLPGISPNHNPPEGLDRRLQAQTILPFAQHRQVWWVNRRPGLDPHVTMEQIADDYAAGMRAKFDGPVDVLGISTGGSVALQLAIDHPELVRRLVVVAAAYRLGARAAAIKRRVGQFVLERNPRRASGEMMKLLSTDAQGEQALSGIGWLFGNAILGQANEDMLAVIEAEDHFDVRDRLNEITAPALVIGGDKDLCYGPGMFAETAERIANGRLLLYKEKGHGDAFGSRATKDALQFLGAAIAGARHPRSAARLDPSTF